MEQPISCVLKPFTLKNRTLRIGSAAQPLLTSEWCPIWSGSSLRVEEHGRPSLSPVARVSRDLPVILSEVLLRCSETKQLCTLSGQPCLVRFNTVKHVRSLAH